MGYLTFLQKKDGTVKTLRADSEYQMKKLRSAECKKLFGELDNVSPMIKDGKPFHFSMFRVARKRGGT